MPAAADSSDLLCPLLARMTASSPSLFYVQKRCFRNLQCIFDEHATSDDALGARHLPVVLSLKVALRIIDIVGALHALGHVILDASPSSFCEGQSGRVESLQLVDMKNVMKLEPQTYSTPASFVTKSGGRFGVPTGLFVMVPQSSLFLGQLHSNCFFSAPEVLKTPGSVGMPLLPHNGFILMRSSGTAADVFSIACIMVWSLTGAAPCALMDPQILALNP